MISFSFLISAILEIIGIGLIFVLLTMIIKGDAIEIQNLEFTSFLENFDISTLLVFIVILYFLKQFFKVFCSGIKLNL